MGNVVAVCHLYITAFLPFDKANEFGGVRLCALHHAERFFGSLQGLADTVLLLESLHDL